MFFFYWYKFSKKNALCLSRISPLTITLRKHDTRTQDKNNQFGMRVSKYLEQAGRKEKEGRRVKRHFALFAMI